MKFECFKNTSNRMNTYVQHAILIVNTDIVHSKFKLESTTILLPMVELVATIAYYVLLYYTYLLDIKGT